MFHILLAAALLIQSANGTVTGRLLSAAGTPAVGVRVTAKPAADAAVPAAPDVLISIAQTDDAGRYRLENVPPGRYYITAGLVGSPTYYPGTAAVGNATVIAITAGATAAVPDFTLQAASVAPIRAAVPAAQDPRYQLLPGLKVPISMDAVMDAKASYEAIGQIIGAHVVFDRRFVPGVPALLRAQGVDAFGALNLLSTQSGNTWTTFGRDSIIVVPVSFGVGNLDLQLPKRDMTRAAVYPGFEPKTAGPLSFDIKSASSAALDTIASAAGLNVIFDRDFRANPSVQLKLDNADIYSALDIVSAQAGAFWVPYDNKTILVAADNTTKRYDIDLRMVKMFHLSNLRTPQEINDTANVVRQTLSPRTYLSIPMANAILLVDTPGKVALAEKLIADLDKSPALKSDTEMIDAAGNLFVVAPTGPRNVTPYRSELQPRAGPFSLDTSLPTRQVYEKLAEAAGITVVFDPNLGGFVPSKLPSNVVNADFFTAIDLISIQTVTFWTPLDSKTIFVTSKNSTNQRDYDPQIVKTFYLTHVNTAQGLNDIMNIVRQAVNVQSVVPNARVNAVVVKDSPRNVALAELLIGQLDKAATGTSAPGQARAVRAPVEFETYSISNAFIRDFSGGRAVSASRSLLQPAVAGPVSIQMNENAKATYEALARTAGLQVTFDSRFTPGSTVAFHVDNVDIVDALNILSLQTKTFWRAVDSKTILVAPAAFTIRNELEPKIQKSFPLTHVQTPQDINAIVNTLKVMLLSTDGVTVNPAMNAIDINETADRVALAAALIAALDIP